MKAMKIDSNVPSRLPTRSCNRSAEETLTISLFLHVGYSKTLVASTPIRRNGQPFGMKAVLRAAEAMKEDAAHTDKWLTRPSLTAPGTSIKSVKRLKEFSMLASSFYCLYGDRVYKGLNLFEVTRAFSLYKNARGAAGLEGDEISPNTAWYVADELARDTALIPYCPRCQIRYYSSIGQCVTNSCPICRKVGLGDFDRYGE